jgi:hypothetical protein
MHRGHSKAPSGVAYDKAKATAEEAAARLFGHDPTIQAVGVGRHRDAYGLLAVKNSPTIVPRGSHGFEVPEQIAGVPAHLMRVSSDARPLSRVPPAGPGSPGESSLVPEQGRHPPLACGVEIHNFDLDNREGFGNEGMFGTLGCFVRTAGAEVGLLSNGHVLARMNRGARGKDRITHPGSTMFFREDYVATLADFVEVRPRQSGGSRD